jgi:ABC-type sugar transport system substrate-binding protein
MRRALVAITLVATACGDSRPSSSHEVYFLVTHGPTTDIGFWGEVLAGADETAGALGVTVEPLHPVVASSGAELDEQMQRAVDADPAGIIATVWGDGMADRVRAANAAAIPVAAINVYPDPTQYAMLGPDGAAPDGKAGFILYAGQNDALAAVDVADALVCRAGAGQGFAGGRCDTATVADAWTALAAGHTVRAVCIIHQQSAGVLTRCQAMEATLVALGLPDGAFDRIRWSESVPGAGPQAITAYFAAPAQAGVDRFLVLSNGHNGLAAYVGAGLDASVKARVTLGTFDVSDLICHELDLGEAVFASVQGPRDQARMALGYLYDYVHDQGALPAAGKAPDGSDDPSWTTSPDGYRWYRTGPQLITRCPS